MSEGTVGVVGAGFMGSGIAESAARGRFDVLVHEPDQAPLDRSRTGIEQSVEKAVARGKVSQDDAGALLDRITWTQDADALAPATIVIEAVFEDPRVKGPLFRTLDKLLPDDTISCVEHFVNPDCAGRIVDSQPAARPRPSLLLPRPGDEPR